MSEIDKEYRTIYLDLIKEKYNSDIDMVFSISDIETSDFFIKITKDNREIDLKDYLVILFVDKPDGTNENMDLVQEESELGLFYCNLKSKFKNVVGKYIAQVLIKDKNIKEQIVTRSKFNYEVTDDLIKDINIDTPTDEEKLVIAFDEETGDLSINKSNYNLESGNLQIGGDE